MTDEDRQLSPYTGWTRAHWETMADRMLTAVRPYASPDHALIDLPGPASRSGPRSDGLEGFARTFLLAAFRLAGAAGDDPLGLASWYADGLAAGVSAASPWRWPRLSEVNQAKVEAASVVIALHETRPWIWDRLDASVRTEVLEWLAEMTGAWVPDNNWVWFQALVEAFCRAEGGRWSQEDIDRTIALTEDWYVGDGWYSDGCPAPGDYRNFDHYNSWAMHLYPLWFCRVAGSAAPASLAERYRERLRQYLTDAEHLTGGDGSPLFQGRSLTYRFAALAPFWAGALFGASPLPPGRTRRIASGMLRHFADAGCLRADGTLSLGWHGEFHAIRQHYSGPGSPYWASKGFAGLLLPASDPVWTRTEEPMAVERGDFTRVLTAPGWIVSGTTSDGIVRVVNHGTDHAEGSAGFPEPDDPFYCRWAYATCAGPELGVEAPADSLVALVDSGGRVSHRRPLRRVPADGTPDGRVGLSRHQAHWPAAEPGAVPVLGPWLTTASVLRGAWEVRAVRVDAGPDGPWALRIGGWAVAGDTPPVSEVRPAPAGLASAGLASAGLASAGLASAGLASAGLALARAADGLTSVVCALRGAFDPAVRESSGHSAFGQHAAVPVLQSTEPVVAGEVYAAAIALTGDPAGPGSPPELAVLAGGRLLVTWPDGETDQVQLPSLPR